MAQGKYLRNLFGGFWPHNRVGINSGHEETRLATADILTGQYAVVPDNGAYLFDQRRINGSGHCRTGLPGHNRTNILLRAKTSWRGAWIVARRRRARRPFRISPLIVP